MARSRSAGLRDPGARWILNPWSDLILFVATPLLILPVVTVAASRWSVEEIALFVFAFGQLGHNLPGMLRAYGDRALFQQYKTRFIVAPLALLLVSAAFIYWDLKGLILVSAMWGIWHAMMQTYGMVRIYDAKSKSFAKWTQRLDWAMCLCWFGLAILMSRGRLVMLLGLFFKSGGPLEVASLIGPLTTVWSAATIVVTLVFLANLIRSWQHGIAFNPIKLLLMLTSFGFFWYTSVTISNVLLGLAMFEVFHDVQYLAIVWVYNRNRVDHGSNVGSFTRFLFRRSGALIGIYLGIIFAYGSLYYLEDWAASGRMKHLLTALLATSGLLHYYFDGFIWKLRHESTRKPLQLSGDGLKPLAAPQLPSWLVHSMKWTAFAVPLCWLAMSEIGGAAPKQQRLEALRDAVPTSASVHLDLGLAYHLQQKLNAAEQEYRKAVACDPTCTKAYNNLALLLVNRGELKDGIACYHRSLEIDPDNAETYNNLGNAHGNLHDLTRAAECFRKALEIDPSSVVALNNLALTFAQAGRMAVADQHFRRALKIAPNDSATHYNFGVFLASQKKLQLAANHLRKVLEIDPANQSARSKLELIRMIQQRASARVELPGD